MRTNAPTERTVEASFFEVISPFGISKDEYITKGAGSSSCLICKHKLTHQLKDILINADWTRYHKAKFKLLDFPICNQCYYHLILFEMVGIDEKGIHPRTFVNAYNICIQNEKNHFFDELDLSCATTILGESFFELERRDEIQSFYCQTFNNVYDILIKSGSPKWWLRPKHWEKILTYGQGRFARNIASQSFR
ncbi:MAG: hypothetical protein COW00_09935 [Bdellovibrio sp. CG12_big_fil_rev_8_21_14_0_65_39_13]|nr:MAG: hypothetical protein COW78_15715 [Bdellovibrio sp. CG22_combo_CG10-13_8_21_14_all_39_27]PIQ59552.1 MAG: hypothetical protein COW00_09935 [Bdellovibrio sp. CG12_big_fil_rev_8_21_14_0_65_39_13]PIR33558.1 MAG: hypothetical protein COV37_15975 [Bdellovibrio sp. CG11_big_fil_rev_8_21_14_0_20_39_38]